MKVLDLLEKYKLKATFYIPSQWRTYLISKDIPPLDIHQVREIADRHEIGSHGVYHKLLTRITPDEVSAEVNDSKFWWEQQGVVVDKFCYPRGYYTEDIKDVVKQAGYKSARTVKVGELQPPKDPFESHTTVHVGIDRKEYGTDWLSYAIQKFDEALERAHHEEIEYHAWGHSAEIEKNGQWYNFEQLLKEVSK